MDELFEIIAFLVTFAIFIVSAIIKQKNKNTEQPQQKSNVFESFFGVEQEDPHDVYNKGELLEESLKRKQAMADEKSSQLQTEEGIDAIPDEEESFAEQESVSTIRDNFDLKKAVIYSEILKRKNF